jgi:4-amino-4-deoxy-L-arabinose transferase-like glycosyltransferase
MKNRQWREQFDEYQSIILFALFLILGAVVILYNTPWGIGVVDDSVFYLSSAENFLEGKGFSWPIGGGELKPLTHYPPLFPFVLAGLGWLKLDMVFAVRALIALIFGANLALIGHLVHRLTGSWKAGLSASSIALLSPILIDVHLLAMTEPLMLLLLLLALIILFEHFEKGGTRSLILMGCLTGLICITRYAGLAFLGAGAVTLIFLGRGDRMLRLANGIRFSIIGAVPLLAWYIRNILLTGSAANREFLYHRITDTQLKQLGSSISVWLFSENAVFGVRFIASLSFVLFLSVMFIWRVNRERESDGWSSALRSDQWRPISALLIYAIIYCVFLFFSLSFVDASTRLDNRILAPLYLLAFLIVFILLYRLQGFTPNLKFVSILLAAIWSLMFVSYALRGTGILRQMAEDGRGFTGRMWQEMEVLEKLKEVPDDFLLYSTEALPLYFLTGRPAYWVPEKFNPLTSREIEDYQDGLELMRTRLEQPNSALIIFTEWVIYYLNASTRTELPPMEEVVEELALLGNFSDGAIYVHPDNRRELRYLRERWR